MKRITAVLIKPGVPSAPTPYAVSLDPGELVAGAVYLGVLEKTAKAAGLGLLPPLPRLETLALYKGPGLELARSFVPGEPAKETPRAVATIYRPVAEDLELGLWEAAYALEVSVLEEERLDAVPLATFGVRGRPGVEGAQPGGAGRRQWVFVERGPRSESPKLEPGGRVA